MKKKEKKIAIISSSPLMIILALELQSQGNKVVVFDKSTVKGGAWGWFNLNLNKRFLNVPKYTNIIHPYNEKERRFIKKMNSYLKEKHKVKVDKVKKNLILIINIKISLVMILANFMKIHLEK